ncbi:Oidioi.mRNA.OKI2018_I69.XSR.g14407.t1.cds [Oikopleura dioica]|uniref:Oidioi.mRNA.OKI2018_I69.XSR.g14407.t1.cds n=1 Tax=Oikopleura dioica TaxID=34765 RepID=A0ABN7S9S6_OIKDI|nr:Oidioi.mRNA.OKI2018_I69.XSR.g14407.t1.cds [Oikopleura dioica]
MAFSGTVRIGDLDDFIGPGLECTKPVDIQKPKRGQVGRVKRNKDGSYADSSGKKLEKAKITLADCLACSGCVTSAETVLITAQSGSLDEFYSVLRKKSSKVVVTLSPQSRSSLAQRFSVDELTILRGLRAVLHKLGVWKTRDLTPFRDVALEEVKNEFLARLNSQAQAAKGPLLCSACPGFVCYAEKTQGDLLVPQLSKVRSPQERMKTLQIAVNCTSLRSQLRIPGKANFRHESEAIAARRRHLPRHCDAMFRQKLEAARQEFQIESNGRVVKDVDCVLATTEIEKLLVDNLEEDDLETVVASFEHEDNDGDVIYSHRGGGSGGYLDYIYRSAAESLFGQKPTGELTFTKVRNNKDFLETTLEIDGEVKLRFAKAYGFRSIQNLVTRLKTKGLELKRT